MSVILLGIPPGIYIGIRLKNSTRIFLVIATLIPQGTPPEIYPGHPLEINRRNLLWIPPWIPAKFLQGIF